MWFRYYNVFSGWYHDYYCILWMYTINGYYHDFQYIAMDFNGYYTDFNVYYNDFQWILKCFWMDIIMISMNILNELQWIFWMNLNE